ncbi:hypothetical protein V2O64_23720 [Verrucomicrobiaceae bacterium 227]
MKKRPWLIWLLIVIVFVIGGASLWMKLVVDKQPTEHPDPGIPDVEVPAPDELEE